jgi:hypothetical protein
VSTTLDGSSTRRMRSGVGVFSWQSPTKVLIPRGTAKVPTGYSKTGLLAMPFDLKLDFYRRQETDGQAAAAANAR